MSLCDVKEIDAIYSSKEIEFDEEEEKAQIEEKYDSEVEAKAKLISRRICKQNRVL